MTESISKKNTDFRGLKKKIGTGLQGASTRLLLAWVNKSYTDTSNIQGSTQIKKK